VGINELVSDSGYAPRDESSIGVKSSFRAKALSGQKPLIGWKAGPLNWAPSRTALSQDGLGRANSPGLVISPGMPAAPFRFPRTILQEFAIKLWLPLTAKRPGSKDLGLFIFEKKLKLKIFNAKCLAWSLVFGYIGEIYYFT
jgi:hypothetical protein